MEPIAEGLTAPIGLVAFPDGTERTAVFEQTGLVHLRADGRLEPEPLIDLRNSIVPLDGTYDERGLLGLAFHPGFAENGRVFVYYSAPVRRDASAGMDHTNTLSEFTIDRDNPDRIDPRSERYVLRFEQPQPNHSGGGLGFGPDGYLYLATGDGGGSGDQDEGHSAIGNAQDPSRLNGKMLRIDVESGEPYTIPSDNPSFGDGAHREIYALGLRNPWRMSWEPDGDHRLLVGDPGWGLFEELNVVVAGGNYGWRVMEGNSCVNLDAPLEPLPTCAAADSRGEPLRGPILVYGQDEVGVAVVPGYVYRGAEIPELRGRYVFADFSAQRVIGGRMELAGSLLVADRTPDRAGLWPWTVLEVAGQPLDEYVTGLGEDATGELYLLVRSHPGPVGTTGRILRITAPSD